jgi:hypothetical protein
MFLKWFFKLFLLSWTRPNAFRSGPVLSGLGNNGVALHCSHGGRPKENMKMKEERSWPHGGGCGGDVYGGVVLAQTVVLFFSCIFLILYFCSCFFLLCSSFLFFVLLLFLFYLSTMFNPLCSGSVVVLLFSVVHSGGFAMANDSSRWLFPCSLLLLLLLPRFSFSFFLFLFSLFLV